VHRPRATELHRRLSIGQPASLKKPTTNHERPTFPQPPFPARFSPFFPLVEPANSFGMAAKTLRKIVDLFPDEIHVQMMRKTSGKAADLLEIRCVKHCG
jgi:hypothetical protein